MAKKKSKSKSKGSRGKGKGPGASRRKALAQAVHPHANNNHSKSSGARQAAVGVGLDGKARGEWLGGGAAAAMSAFPAALEEVDSVVVASSMKENCSPNVTFFTAREDLNGASLALLSTGRQGTARKAVAAVESPLDANGFREKMASFSSTPEMSKTFSVSPRKTSGGGKKEKNGGDEEAERAPPLVQVLKREISSSDELQGLIRMRQILAHHMPAGAVQDVAEWLAGGGEGQEFKAYPRLVIDGMEIGGLETVLELEEDGILAQMVASGSFTRGFLQAGPCPPEGELKVRNLHTRAHAQTLTTTSVALALAPISLLSPSSVLFSFLPKD